MPAPTALLICSAIEFAIAQIISQNLTEFSKAKLSGKTICVKLKQLDFPLYFICSRQRILVLSDYQSKASVSVSLDLTTLKELKAGANVTELIKQDKLLLDGDLNCLQAFVKFFELHTYDFEETLSHYLGDLVSYKLVSNLRQGQSFISKWINQTGQHLSELATEEYQIAAGKLAFIHFSDQLDDLSKEVEQAEKRLNQLMDKLTP